MTNKQLITKLLDFPMDAEINIDMHPQYPKYTPVCIDFGDEDKNIWITNYK